MQGLDSNLRMKTSAVEDIYLCAALDFDLNHSWLSKYYQSLARLYSCYFPVCIYGYSWKHHLSAVILVLGFQTVSIGLPAICLPLALILKDGMLRFASDNDCLL